MSKAEVDEVEAHEHHCRGHFLKSIAFDKLLCPSYCLIIGVESKVFSLSDFLLLYDKIEDVVPKCPEEIQTVWQHKVEVKLSIAEERLV
jgi:hypothetical protein